MKLLKALEDHSRILERINRSDLEIASIEFGNRKHSFPVPDGFTVLGKQECDAIAICHATDEVVVLDHEVEGRIIAVAANNLYAFLSALSVIEDHYEKCEANEDLYEDEAFMASTANSAGAKAGGEKYVGFYMNLFGI